MSSAVGTRGPDWLARFTWQHPEWWTYVAAFGAWSFMLQHAYQHGAHLHHHMMPPAQEAVHWLLMIAAMMLPLQYEQLRWVAFRSYASQRKPALLAYTLGYLGAWLLAGLPIVLLRSARFSHTHWLAVIAFGVAALWAFAPARQRAALRCHFRRGLAPRGLAGLVDTAKFGAQLGASCVVSCWPLMLGCAVTGHGIEAMVGGAAVAAGERLAFRPSLLRSVVGPSLLGAYYTWKAL
jgi:hypothetical protein